MSEYTLIYSEIEDSVSQAKKAEDELYDCMSFLSKKVMSKLDDLPGSDDQGNIAQAKAQVSAKVSRMKAKYDVFNPYSTSFTRLQEDAAEADTLVANKIEELADPHKMELSLTSVYRSVTGFFYNLFCVDMADFISEHVIFGDKIIKFLRGVGNTLSHWKENVLNYFNHGAGQYIKNVLVSVAAVIGAVVATIGAVVLAVSGGWIVLAVMAIILGTVSVILTFCNMAAVTEDNTDALKHYMNGRKDLAHYYGGTENVLDWSERHDFGSAEDNVRIETIAGIMEITRKTANLGLDLINLFCAGYKVIESAAKLPNVYGLDGKTVMDKDYSMSNMKKNFERMRYEKMLEDGAKVVTGKDGVTQTVKKGFFKTYFGRETDFLDDLSVYKLEGTAETPKDALKKIKTGKKIGDFIFESITDGKTKTEKFIEDFEDYFESPTAKDGVGIIKDAVSALSTGESREYVDTYGGGILKIIEEIFDIFTTAVAEPA